MLNNNIYTIGEVAEIFNISVEDIRHMEHSNLIKPSSEGEYGYCLFNEEDIGKLRMIMYMISAGFSEEEIKDEI